MAEATTHLFTNVVAACDAKLLGQLELLIAVQDFLLPLSDTSPAEASRIGGTRLLSLWVEVALFRGTDLDEYSGAALFAAIQQTREIFIDRALKANVHASVWMSVANFAVRHNDRAILQLLHERVPSLTAPHALEIAADMGDPSLIKWIHESGFGKSVVTEQTLARAAGKAHVDVIEWIVKTQDLPDKDAMIRRAMSRAAKCGQLGVLRWFREHTDIWWSPQAIGAALLNGHFEVADWMYELNETRLKTYAHEYEDPSPPRMDLNSLLPEVYAKGDMRILDWLRHRKELPRITAKHAERVKKAGHVHVLDYALRHYPGTISVMHFGLTSVAGGSIVVAQWALERGQLYNSSRMVTIAARNGHIEFMRWYTTAMQGRMQMEYDLGSLEATIAKGYLECARFLVENDFSTVTSDAVACAASHGHLATAQWLLAQWLSDSRREQDAGNDNDTEDDDNDNDSDTEEDNGDHDHEDTSDQPKTLPWLGTAMGEAAANGHLDVVKWIFGLQGFPADSLTMLHQAAANGHVAVVKWMLGIQAFSIGSSIIGDAAASGHLNVVRFLVKHAPECGVQNAASLAASRGQLRVVKYLLSHAPQSREVCNLFAHNAQRRGYSQVAAWIQRHGWKATA